MKKELRALRAELGFTHVQFGKMLGFAPSAAEPTSSGLCSGQRKVSRFVHSLVTALMLLGKQKRKQVAGILIEQPRCPMPEEIRKLYTGLGLSLSEFASVCGYNSDPGRRGYELLEPGRAHNGSVVNFLNLLFAVGVRKRREIIRRLLQNGAYARHC